MKLIAMKSVLSDLKPLLKGEVADQTELLSEVSHDFGGIISRQPQAVVRPQSAHDIVQVVKYAAAQELTISSRGLGHSISGQSQNQDGILLDLRGLDNLQSLTGEYFEADVGVTWRQILERSLPLGLTPPVITNYLDVTIGGTHSAGGIGASSFRCGTQADNCLELEVVTGEGELLQCSPEENSELFYHVLAGYGQFGIITRIHHRLRKYKPWVRTYLLFYDDLDALLADKETLIQEDRVGYLASLPSACIQGASRAGGMMQPFIQWFYTLQISVEIETPKESTEHVFAGLNFRRFVHREDLSFSEFITPPPFPPDMVSKPSHPWTDMFLPRTVAKPYIQATLNQLPMFLDFTRVPNGSYCLLRRNTKLPMFRLPEGEVVIGFGVYPTFSPEQVPLALDNLARITTHGMSLGGKRYLTGWIQFGLEQWRMHFGEHWLQINAMKKKYDPKNILNPGFIQYEND